MRARFYTLDVFTTTRFAGNPLAVFPDASGIPVERMPQIAREFNLSETVFVLPPENAAHTRRVRIYTPNAELPFAGHPTIGTAFLLGLLGEVKLTDGVTDIVLEEGVGPVSVSIVSDGREPLKARLVAPRIPETGPPPPSRNELAAALSLEPGDLLDGRFQPEALSCGVPFLFVPLVSREPLGRIRINGAAWAKSIERFWAPDVFAFAFDPELPGSHVRARMFAPAFGISEDPATGSACAALGGYLASRETASDGDFHWVIEQGFEMGRPSIMELDTEKRGGAVTAIRVGGGAVLVSAGTVET